MGYGGMAAYLLRLARGLVLGSAMFIACVLTVSSEDASAGEIYGTSPSFGTGVEWSVYLGYYGVGDIIEWYWTSGDSLIFTVLYTSDTTTRINGLSSDDGFVVANPGHYGLAWYNDNWFFSATVTYWATGFTPWTTISTPVSGSLLNSNTISVQGATDPFSSCVLVGPDAMHLRETTWSGDYWAVDAVVLSEGQNTILVRTCYWLDYYGYENITHDMTTQVTVDSIAPELLITHPDNDTYDSGDIETSWQCSDSNGIVKTEIKFDAWGWQEVTGTTYIASMPDGVHTVQVRVADPAGNQATRVVTFTKDTILPELAVISPVIVSDGTYLQDLVEVSWQCSDDGGIASQEVRVDGLVWQEVTTDSYTVQLVDGHHLIELRVTDLAGNAVTSQMPIVTDTVAPEVHVLNPLMDSKISENDVTLFFGADDELSGVDHLEIQIDGGNWMNVDHDSTYQLTGLEDGWHSVTVKAVDQSGNAATETVGFGIYTSIWSTNGPYQGIPLFGLIAAVTFGAVVTVLLLRRRRGGPTAACVPKEEPTAQAK